MKKTINYVPDEQILRRYAEVLINYALNSGAGVKAGEVVECVVPDISKALARELHNVILEAGAHPMIRLMPTGFERDFFTRANVEQLEFFPAKYLKERINLVDHMVGIIADEDPFELQGIDPQKILASRRSKKAYMDWRNDKEARGKFTWTLGLWGVQAKAELVGLSLEEYWQQIIQACFLDEADPLSKWRTVAAEQQRVLQLLNAMPIKSLHVKGPDADLKVGLGVDRVWAGGSGRNIPSFEIFTSPDWRGTEGWIRFNQAVYRYGQVLDGVELHFSKGRVTKGIAEVGQSLLDTMLQTENADKLGEFSLTDKDMSRITHVMAETLFDENIGGPFGNMHVALGMSYKDCYRGDPVELNEAEAAKRGFNDSAEHTDIVTTADRTVTATMVDGGEKVIYAKGKFQV